MHIQPDGVILMRPVKVVPATVQEPSAAYVVARAAPDTRGTREWAQAHAQDIEQYNAWASAREPYAQRVRRWREQGA